MWVHNMVAQMGHCNMGERYLSSAAFQSNIFIVIIDTLGKNRLFGNLPEFYPTGIGCIKHHLGVFVGPQWGTVYDGLL